MTTTPEIVYDFIEKLTDEDAIKSIETDGGIQPHFYFYIFDKEGVNGLAFLPIEKEFMDKGRAGKEEFMQIVYPEVKQKIKDEGFTIAAILFASEAWRYNVKGKNYNPAIPLNESNSEEIIMLSFHYEGGHTDFIYPTTRDNGNLKLLKPEVIRNEYAKEENIGRFAKLF